MSGRLVDRVEAGEQAPLSTGQVSARKDRRRRASSRIPATRRTTRLAMTTGAATAQAAIDATINAVEPVASPTTTTPRTTRNRVSSQPSGRSRMSAIHVGPGRPPIGRSASSPRQIRVLHSSRSENGTLGSSSPSNAEVMTGVPAHTMRATSSRGPCTWAMYDDPAAHGSQADPRTHRRCPPIGRCARCGPAQPTKPSTAIDRGSSSRSRRSSRAFSDRPARPPHARVVRPTGQAQGLPVRASTTPTPGIGAAPSLTRGSSAPG